EGGWRWMEARVRLRLEPGHQHAAHPVAHQCEVGVRAVDREPEAALGEEAAHVDSRRAEQRSEEPAAHGMHTGEASTPRAAEKPEQHRLDLVVTRVAGDDAARPDLAHDRRARAVADAAGTGRRPAGRGGPGA